jgi:hypothetical protein
LTFILISYEQVLNILLPLYLDYFDPFTCISRKQDLYVSLTFHLTPLPRYPVSKFYVLLNFNLMPLPGYPVILETNVAGSPSSIVVFFGPSTTDGALTASICVGASSVSGGPTGTKTRISGYNLHKKS